MRTLLPWWTQSMVERLTLSSTMYFMQSNDIVLKDHVNNESLLLLGTHKSLVVKTVMDSPQPQSPLLAR